MQGANNPWNDVNDNDDDDDDDDDWWRWWVMTKMMMLSLYDHPPRAGLRGAVIESLLLAWCMTDVVSRPWCVVIPCQNPIYT